MFRKFNLFVLSLCLLFCGVGFGAGGVIDGDGTEGAPYVIEDVDDFDTFADSDNASTYWSEGVYTQLACDVDLSGRIYSTAVIAADANSTSGSFDGEKFSGVFDGNGFKITGLMIDDGGLGNYLGLFGYVDGGEVHKLGVENVSITGAGWAVGGLVGWSEGGRLSGCRFYGDVSGSSSVGGLVGKAGAGGALSDCHSAGSVIGSGSSIGGLIGSCR